MSELASESSGPGAHPFVVTVSGAEADQAAALAAELAGRYATVESETFQSDAAGYAQELPRALRRGLNTFRLDEPSCLCVIRGFTLDDRKLGPTPAHWRQRPDPSPTAAEEFLFYLCASVLGDPIAWSTKQDGHIMHTIAPIRGEETEQLASSSETTLTWHTEDSFHPLRADYLGLMCLRNPDGVPTTVACVEDLELPEPHRSTLFQPRFTIVPDGSHLDPTGVPAGIPTALLERSQAGIRRMAEHPEPVPLLFGDPSAPYLRLDQFFASAVPGDAEAEAALSVLFGTIERRLSGYALRPGEICFIDNYKAVHGRDPFRARYDGTDRWLKRLNVTRDLRKSREVRLRAGSRMIV